MVLSYNGRDFLSKIGVGGGTLSRACLSLWERCLWARRPKGGEGDSVWQVLLYPVR